MKFPTFRQIVLTAALVAATPALAQQTANRKDGSDYPNKPVRVIVPFTPGSLTDVSARLISAKLADKFNQQFVVDNRSGAGGTTIAAEANPDGHTLFFHSSGYAIAPALYPKWKVDMLRDFQAISIIVLQPHTLTVSPNGPKTLKEFMDVVRKKGEKFVWSHAGVGSSTHLVGEKFFLEMKAKHTSVGYKGTPEALLDAVTGRVEVFFSPFGNAVPFIREGKALGLAVTSKKRNPVLPNIPTVDEAGLPGFEYDVWIIAAVQKKAPKEVIATLSSSIREALKSADVIKAFEVQGGVTIDQTPEQAQAFAAKEIEVLGKVARAANVPTF